MITSLHLFRVDAIDAPADIDERVGARAAALLRLKPQQLHGFRILNRTVDARRARPALLYTLLLDVDDNAGLPPATPEEIASLTPPSLTLPESRLLHPIVVGTGPAGIFAALALALAGAKPIVIDRGPAVETRVRDYEQMLVTRELNEESNLLIGEGGAGTFSDGKLYTGTRDLRAAWVLHTFVEAGAPPEIRYLKRPHIGSDRLRKAAIELRHKIEALGGEFRFQTEIREPLIRDGVCAGVVTSAGEKLEAPAVLLAPGLGGRTLVQRLAGELAVAHEFKSFQIGCRVEHPQELIDRQQYHLHTLPRPAALGAAEYHMVARNGGDVSGVSSFCMCPGGEIVNASAWTGRSITNGMSLYARAGEFANACLITTLRPELFGSSTAAYREIERLERAVWERGGRDYAFPAQNAAAFLAGRGGLAPGGSCRWGMVPGRLDKLIPSYLATPLRSALRCFDRICPGFIRDGKLVGLESCVSSPLRFTRNPETLESSVKRLYLGGEGTGSAGGIMSAAVDGVRLAEAMLRSAGTGESTGK